MTAGRSSYGWKSRSTRLSAAAPCRASSPRASCVPCPLRSPQPGRRDATPAAAGRSAPARSGRASDRACPSTAPPGGRAGPCATASRCPQRTRAARLWAPSWGRRWTCRRRPRRRAAPGTSARSPRSPRSAGRSCARGAPPPNRPMDRTWQSPACRRTDGLRVDVLLPEHHGHPAPRQAPRQDGVRQQRDVADHNHGRVLGGDGPGGATAVGQFLADAGERRVLGEGPVHGARLEGEGRRVARLEVERALPRRVRRAVLMGDLVPTSGQGPAQLRLPGMSRVVVHHDPCRPLRRHYPGNWRPATTLC